MSGKQTLLVFGATTISALLLRLTVISVIAVQRRNRCQQERQRRYAQKFASQEALLRMSNNDAHPIIKDLQQIDFPWAFEVSLAASLFYPFGIPSISKVLAKTGQFKDVHVASKRTADTACFVVDMSQYPPESERACAAISRMNYIHGQYQKSVKNEDLLYTLALLAWLPVRFIQRWEWRILDDAEVYAVGVYWNSIGDAMGLSYQPMEDFLSSPQARDGREFMEYLRLWSEHYELENMRHDPLNIQAAKQTEEVLMYGVPRCLRGSARQALSSLMDERMRMALHYPRPHPIIHLIVHGTLQLRKMYLRHLAFPRTKRHLRSTEHPDVFGRYFRLTWAAEPWYVKGNQNNRSGIKAWIMGLYGLPLPGDEGLKSEGYRSEELGPQRFEGKGLAQFEAGKESLMASDRGKCPF